MEQLEEFKGGQDPLHKKSYPYVEENFPFAAASGEFASPYWAKCLLFEKYNISDVNKVINEFNIKGIHDASIEKTILPDIDLEKYTDYEVFLRSKEWKDSKVIQVVPDEGQPFDLKVPLDLPLYEFKRVVLNKQNKPFFLDQNLPNSSLLKEAVQDMKIYVYFNLNQFRLELQEFEGQVKLRTGLLTRDSEI